MLAQFFILDDSQRFTFSPIVLIPHVSFRAGIGLTSVRGTGTSGYVQTNKFKVRRARHEKNRKHNDDSGSTKHSKSANKDIIEHNRKREIEVQVMEYRIALEDDDVDEEKIEELVAKYRMELMEKDTPETVQEKTKQETHEIAARKERKMENMRRALGFEDDIVEGEAFDRELQEKKKQERIAERKRREDERIEENRRIEKRRRKMHKEGYYEKDERPERYDGNQYSSESESDFSSRETSKHDSMPPSASSSKEE